MSLAPLLSAGPIIQIHAAAAMGAFALGAVQLAAPKGTIPHRTVGWIWAVLMLAVAVSSLWIHDIRMLGPFSAIHLLSLFVLVLLPIGIWSARRHAVARHRKIMTRMFIGALIVAGFFTFMPGRIMYRVAFGG